MLSFFSEIFLDYTVDTTDTKPHCNVTDKQTNEQTHKMTQVLQVSLEPNLDLVLRPTNPIPALADILGRIPQCAYKPAQRSWVVNIGRMEAEVGMSVYDIIANDVKPTLEGQGYSVKFNQQVSLHARSLADVLKTQTDDFHSRICVGWENSLTSLGVTPFKHQLDAVQFWLDNQGRGIFGHEMGTGKTISAILASRALGLSKILIFIPAGLKAQWKTELNRLLSSHEVIDYDGKNWPQEDKQTVVLVSYAMAQKVTAHIDRYGVRPEIVICDECHYIKSPKAQRTKAVVKLAKKVPYFLGLSGTPIINRPVDLFPVLNLTAPDKFFDWYKFTRRYCNGHEGKFGYMCDGLTNAPKLHAELQNVMHRVRKDECLDLPSKTRSVIPLDFFQYNRWTQEYYDLREAIQQGDAHFSQLRQFIGQSKVNNSVEWIVDFLDSTDEKLVVFCHHVSIQNSLVAKINAQGKAKSEHKPIAVGFTGETSAQERNKAISKFQETKAKYPARVLVTTVGAGGTGLNLQVANQMLIVEATFSVGEMLQAEDRIHRSGQKTPCTIHYVIASGTYDRVLYRLLSSKMDMMNKVVDGDFSKDLNIFDEMMKEI